MCCGAKSMPLYMCFTVACFSVGLLYAHAVCRILVFLSMIHKMINEWLDRYDVTVYIMSVDLITPGCKNC